MLYGRCASDDTEDIELDGVREADIGVGKPPSDMGGGAGGEEFDARNSSQEASLTVFDAVARHGQQLLRPHKKTSLPSACAWPDVMGQSKAGGNP